MNKVKAFTLLETLIAMVIMLSIAYIFFITISRINYSLNPGLYYKGYLVARKEFSKNDILVEYPEPYEVSGLIIEKSMIIDTTQQLYRVTLTIYLPGGRKIYAQEKILSSRIEL